MRNLRRILCAAVWLVVATAYATDANWSDVTSRYMTNPGFDNNSSDGWTWESTTGTVGPSANCLRFYNGTCTFTQQLSNLPKGTYRLSVQGFYRANGNSYEAHQNGTENITAYLYAGNSATKLVSVYSEGLDERGAGNWQNINGKFYPDNSSSAAAAFEAGLYKDNVVEFEVQGNVTIGVRCERAESSNYCVLDNFKLEYASPISPDGKAWIDITSQVLLNPGFTDNSQEGWTWESNASSQTAREDCMEFWNGTFNIWQDVNYNHQGKYRLSVQTFYRCQGNDQDYRDYQNGSQNITAFMYAGEKEQKLMSVYAESSDEWVDGGWGAGNGWWGGGAPYFPNSMESARVFFDKNKYWNTMEFESDGNFRIGLKNTSSMGNNWCIFDNFCLEYYGDYVKVTSIDIQIDHTTFVVGESVVASAIVSPANATLSNVQWSSNNEAVVKVSADGTVTAVAAGQATITAIATDGSGIKASVKIEVEHNTAEPGSIVINEIMASNIEEAISPAFNFDGWMEIYNTTDKPVELTGLLLSDNKNQLGPWTMPAEMGAVPAKGYLVVWFDSNDIAPTNAPFKLDTDGGNITISDADGKVIASQDYPASLERISYARLTDGAEEWGYTGTLTPGASNNGISLQKIQLAAPVVDQPSQVFTGMLSINVTIPGGCTLRYTTDGTLPTLTNGEISKSGQFDVRGTSNYRFRLFADDMLPSRVTTRSYILQEFEPLLPVVSVVTDPDFLYSKEIGVMEKGPNGRPGNGQSSKCNWNMNWERPVNFSYLDANGEMVLNQDVNLEMCGGWSRAWTPHAFKLKGSKEMGGDKNLNYPFFEQKPYIRNRTLQIRNGGNDNNCRFKDPSLQYIAQSSGLNLDCQSYQPVHEFINGQYIGVLNVREPNNKHYVYANYGWDDDEIDQFEMSPDSGYVQKCGTADAFNMLVDDLSPDAANDETYAEICRLLDIDEYINYMAVEMFLGSTDWPQNNVKGFRHRNNGRFRFVLFDIDHAFNTSDPFNTFRNKEWYYFDELYPRGLGRIFDQIRLVTLFENLLENQDFRRRFIDAYCIVAGSVYQNERSGKILDELFERVQPAMRVNGSSAATTYNSVKSSLNNRLNSSNNALKNYGRFELKNVSGQRVILDSDTEGAKLFVNDQEIPTGAFNGYLYSPVTLMAKEPAGYQFVGWLDAKGVVQSTDLAIELPTGSVTLTASFKKLSEQQLAVNGITPVRINEVSGSNDSYIDEYGKKGDWLELYNTTDSDIDVEGMYLTDDLSNDTKYQITKGDTKANTVIKPRGHLVIWCDNKRATSDNGLHASFKIDGDGGQLQLMAADRSWKDVIRYGAHDARTTVVRYPDGGSEVFTTNMATIGQSNIKTSYMSFVDQEATDVALRTINAANGFRVFYGNQQIMVKSDEPDAVNVSVYRADGMLVSQSTLDVVGGTARLSVSELEYGFYVVRAVNSDGTIVSCKFMK